MNRSGGRVTLATMVAALALLFAVSPAVGAGEKVRTGGTPAEIQTRGGTHGERGGVIATDCVTVEWLTSVLGVSTSKCRLGGNLGYAIEGPIGPPRILIERSYLPRRWRANQETAVAVFIVGHELGHVRRGPSESGANEFVQSRWCWIVGLLRGPQPQLPDCHVLRRLVPPSLTA
jgi:hypothetical protein